MAGYEAGSSEEDKAHLGATRRRDTHESIVDAARKMQPHLEALGLTEEDVYTVSNLSLLAFPVPEELRHHQATHVAGEVYRDEKNDRSGMRKVIFLAKENPKTSARVVIDISNAEKPLWGLDRFLHPSPYEKKQEKQERGFQVWLTEVMKDPEWFMRGAPAFSWKGSYPGQAEDFVPDPLYFERRIKEVWQEAKEGIKIPE